MDKLLKQSFPCTIILYVYTIPQITAPAGGGGQRAKIATWFLPIVIDK